jgi:GTP-dependent phosphoenolpyruvate carboxykinase
MHDALQAVDATEWLAEADAIEEHYGRFGDRVPVELTA